MKASAKKQIAKAEANLAAVEKLVEAAEIWFAANTAEDEHPVFNNSVYDLRVTAKEDLRMAKRGEFTGCDISRSLAAANID